MRHGLLPRRLGADGSSARALAASRPSFIGTPAAAAGRCFHPEPSCRAQSLAGGAALVWETVNALAARPGMVNMGQGFPDFDGAPVARQQAAAALGQGAPMNQYSPQPGLLCLRQEVGDFYQRRYGADYDPATEIVVTAGAQEALAAAFLAWLEPGDEVVLFDPCYPFMLGAARLAGAHSQPMAASECSTGGLVQTHSAGRCSISARRWRPAGWCRSACSRSRPAPVGTSGRRTDGRAAPTA